MMILSRVKIAAVAAVMLLAMQNGGKAQDLADMKSSLQGCLNDALTAGNFDKPGWGREAHLWSIVPTRRRVKCT